jgi:hypothetical protein
MSAEQLQHEIQEGKKKLAEAEVTARSFEEKAREVRGVMAMLKTELQAKLKECNDALMLTATQEALKAAAGAQQQAEAAKADAEASKVEAEKIREQANALHQSLGKREQEIEEQLARVKAAAEALEVQAEA